MSVYTTIQKCRMCGSSDLREVIDLGMMSLTGIFPEHGSKDPPEAPLRLLHCEGSCGLVQLADSCDLSHMYGENYGYRSGLNPSMVSHLHNKVDAILAMEVLSDGDIVIDVGSNDGTTLARYPQGKYELIGVDPSAGKFKQFYREDAHIVEAFFPSSQLSKVLDGRKAQVITSISMFYDLEQPLEFMQSIRDTLAEDGIWVFEQSYLPGMLEANSFDTICHEHLEYYSLTTIVWAANKVGFDLIDIEFNQINGGSFSVLAKPSKGRPALGLSVQRALAREESLQQVDRTAVDAFVSRVIGIRESITHFLEGMHRRQIPMAGLGASTKGNVLLQYCGIDSTLLPVIGEVNPDKYGKMTPGSRILIESQKNVLASGYENFLVLPWHFREFLLRVPEFHGRRLVFPLPTLQAITPTIVNM